MQKIVQAAVLAMALSAVASAGLKNATGVVINGHTAYGHVGAVRNSADSRQFITCGLEAGAAGTFSAHCSATNSQGLSRSCVTQSPNLVNIVATMQGDSHVIFVWDDAGECTYININQNSAAEPKTR